ncbi:MAG TPA: YCF48-related protein [Pyrinomonadaceae bacterium]
MNKHRLRRLLANLLVFLSTSLSSAWLFTPVEQPATAPYVRPAESSSASRFERLGMMPPGDYWRHLQFINLHEGWFSDSHTLWHTTDGGKTWRVLVSEQDLQGTVNSFHFANSNLGWMIQSGELYRTKDGGVTWDHIRAPMSDGAGSLDSFHFEGNCQVGWIPGGVYYPVKSGNCKNSYLGNHRGMHRVRFRDVNYGLALDGQGFMYETTDSGASWHRLDTSIKFESIRFMNETNAWAVSTEIELVRISLVPRR